MKCVILAGGRGSRLTPLTNVIPKPLVEIGDKPILYHIIERFKKQGIKEFIVLGGYKYDLLFDYIAKNPIRGVSIKVFDTGVDTPTGERVKMAQLKDEPYIITYGDDISNVDIREVKKVFDFQSADLVMTAGIAHSQWGHIKMSSEGEYVYDLLEKPQLPNRINIGNWIVKGKLTHRIRAGETLEQWAQRIIDDDEKIVSAYKYDGFFCGMNTFADYIKLCEIWKNNQSWETES